MAKDLDTEIAEKWEEAVELARAIEDSFDCQAEVFRDYALGPSALQTVLRRLIAGDDQIAFDEALERATEIGDLESLDFSYLKEVTDYTYDLLQLLRELEELEGEREVSL